MQYVEKIINATVYDKETGNKIIELPIETFTANRITFYAGEPSEKQKQIASHLMDLIENIDEIMGAESRFENIAKE